MIVAMNYADQGFKKAQHWNSKSAKKWGADRVIEYGPEDMDEAFREKNREILSAPKGGGYYLWKPYFLRKALDGIGKDDYLIYSDSGSVFINKIQYLIDCMEREKTDIMVFSLEKEMLEKKYTKRDAFLLLDCDEEKYADTPQSIGGYVILKNTEWVKSFLDKDLKYAEDIRAISDQNNVLGKDNYEGFVAHRHDQSIWSLMVKKAGIKRFRDPSQYGIKNSYEKDVGVRSQYPQIIYSHRKNAGSMLEIWWLNSIIYRVYRKCLGVK